MGDQKLSNLHLMANPFRMAAKFGSHGPIVGQIYGIVSFTNPCCWRALRLDNLPKTSFSTQFWRSGMRWRSLH
jgi:hypothetical protein